MEKQLKLITTQYLYPFMENPQIDWSTVADYQLLKTDVSLDKIITNCALYSSKMDGNSLDLKTYKALKGKNELINNKEADEIENLIKAYQFIAKNPLNEENFLKAQEILSQTLLPANQRGQYRKHRVVIADSATGFPSYFTLEPEHIKDEMAKLFDDVQTLIPQRMILREMIFYASMLHLTLVLIHPFGGGNNRTARLLERWFLLSKLDGDIWHVPMEEYYYENRVSYNANLNIGHKYSTVKWEKSLPFLFMLPHAFMPKK